MLGHVVPRCSAITLVEVVESESKKQFFVTVGLTYGLTGGAHGL